MIRTVVASFVVLVAATTCGARATTSPQAPLAPAATLGTTIVPPPGAGPAAQVGIDHVAADAIHPGVLRAALEAAGFAGGAERVETAGDGAFARVVTRRLAFDDVAGAASFVAWLEANAGLEFFSVERLTDGVPPDVLLLRHVPDGCCPREVRIYLAAWTDGAQVITVKAQGPRSTDRAMVSLVDDVRSGERS